jgi:hypothetical protein
MRKIYAFMLLLLLAGLFSTLFTPSSVNAQIGADSEAVREIHVNPQNGDLWVFWGNKITHHASDGKGKQLTLPLEAMWQVNYQRGLVFMPEGVRYYYFDNKPDSPNFQKPIYLDLNTGKSTIVSFEENFANPKCRTATTKAVYNPISKAVYLWCAPEQAGFEPHRTLVISGDKATALSQYLIYDYNPANQKLYAAYHYQASLDPYPSNSPFVDVLTLDAQTLAPQTAQMIVKSQPYTTIRSIAINSKTGWAYVLYSFCYAKCQIPSQTVVDKDLNKINGIAPGVEYHMLVNEATNQLYGYRLYGLNRENIALKGDYTSDQQLAGFYWTPLAVNNALNLVYAYDGRGAYNRQRAGDGSGILVIDGNNHTVLSFIPIKSPSPALLGYAKPLSAPPAGFNGRFFPLTGHTLKGRFLEFWERNGGLAIFGYPLTEEFLEYNQEDGKLHTVQYFERNRFEYHPDLEGTPFVVQLGLLGRNFSAQTGAAVSGNYQSGETEPIPGGVRFKETGHTLTGKFYDYWRQKGGLVIFGLPVTEPLPEVNPVDGKIYIVQYFERNRFELHPEFVGTEYEVLLGLLGKQVLWSRGWDIYR